MNIQGQNDIDAVLIAIDSKIEDIKERLKSYRDHLNDSVVQGPADDSTDDLIDSISKLDEKVAQLKDELENRQKHQIEGESSSAPSLKLRRGLAEVQLLEKFSRFLVGCCEVCQNLDLAKESAENGDVTISADHIIKAHKSLYLLQKSQEGHHGFNLEMFHLDGLLDVLERKYLEQQACQLSQLRSLWALTVNIDSPKVTIRTSVPFSKKENIKRESDDQKEFESGRKIISAMNIFRATQILQQYKTLCRQFIFKLNNEIIEPIFKLSNRILSSKCKSEISCQRSAGLLPNELESELDRTTEVKSWMFIETSLERETQFKHPFEIALPILSDLFEFISSNLLVHDDDSRQFFGSVLISSLQISLSECLNEKTTSDIQFDLLKEIKSSEEISELFSSIPKDSLSDFVSNLHSQNLLPLSVTDPFPKLRDKISSRWSSLKQFWIRSLIQEITIQQNDLSAVDVSLLSELEFFANINFLTDSKSALLNRLRRMDGGSLSESFSCVDQQKQKIQIENKFSTIFMRQVLYLIDSKNKSSDLRADSFSNVMSFPPCKVSGTAKRLHDTICKLLDISSSLPREVQLDAISSCRDLCQLWCFMVPSNAKLTDLSCLPHYVVMISDSIYLSFVLMYCGIAFSPLGIDDNKNENLFVSEFVDPILELERCKKFLISRAIKFIHSQVISPIEKLSIQDLDGSSEIEFQSGISTLQSIHKTFSKYLPQTLIAPLTAPLINSFIIAIENFTAKVAVSLSAKHLAPVAMWSDSLKSLWQKGQELTDPKIIKSNSLSNFPPSNTVSNNKPTGSPLGVFSFQNENLIIQVDELSAIVERTGDRISLWLDSVTEDKNEINEKARLPSIIEKKGRNKNLKQLVTMLFPFQLLPVLLNDDVGAFIEMKNLILSSFSEEQIGILGNVNSKLRKRTNGATIVEFLKSLP